VCLQANTVFDSQANFIQCLPSSRFEVVVGGFSCGGGNNPAGIVGEECLLDSLSFAARLVGFSRTAMAASAGVRLPSAD